MKFEAWNLKWGQIHGLPPSSAKADYGATRAAVATGDRARGQKSEVGGQWAEDRGRCFCSHARGERGWIGDGEDGN